MLSKKLSEFMRYLAMFNAFTIVLHYTVPPQYKFYTRFLVLLGFLGWLPVIEALVQGLRNANKEIGIDDTDEIIPGYDRIATVAFMITIVIGAVITSKILMNGGVEGGVNFAYLRNHW